ncbi:MAG: hypothetical protein ABJH52_06845 [Henriciella sp.]
MTGLAVIAVVQTQTVHAAVQNSDVWIGLSDNVSGFLLDEETGDLWMTGPCLKTLEQAQSAGSVWMSHTIELVSIGRGMATLDQLFELDTDDLAPSITVTSNGRGGAQSFPAQIDRNCDASGTCADLIASQQACQG